MVSVSWWASGDESVIWIMMERGITIVNLGFAMRFALMMNSQNSGFELDGEWDSIFKIRWCSEKIIV